MKRIELVGKQFGRLTVLKLGSIKSGTRFWECSCVCGKVLEVRGVDLRNGHTQSCGCLMREQGAERQFKHGRVGTRIYRAWAAAKNRVTNSQGHKWSDYGGRGISMHAPWLASAARFIEDVLAEIGEPPPGTSLDRRDNLGDYVPGNIRWATAKEQGRNTRRNRMLSYEGQLRCLVEWCEILKLPYDRTKRRLHLGWETSEAFKL